MANTYNAVKVFSATKSRDRDALGDRLTSWLRANPGVEIVRTEITQSSDSEFHCLSITVMFVEPATAAGAKAA